MKSNNLIIALSLNPQKDIQDRQRVFDTEGICPTLRSTDYKDPTKILEKKAEIIEVGNLKEGQQNWDSPQTGRVYSTEGISPTLNTCGGGGHEVKIVEKKALGGIYTDVTENFNRGLYPNVSRTIKATKNDAGVIERQVVAMRGRNPDNPSDRTAGSPTEQRLEPNADGICNTITTVAKDNLILEYRVCYKVRKLTAREQWRLMGFSDEDYEKAAEVNSKTQLYKQSGNSIVKDVLMAIFSQLNIKGVPMWNEVHHGTK